MIKHLIFDFDGVIIDSEILAAKAFFQVLKSMNINNYTPQSIAAKYAGNKTIKVAKELSKVHKISDHILLFNNVMRTVSTFFDKELKAVEQIEDFLKINDFEFYIGSNSGKQRIIKGLNNVNLNKYFKSQNIYTFEMVKNPKPSPDIYLKVVEDNNLKKEEVLVLEDSIPGVRSAVDAGLKVLGVVAASHWKNISYQSLMDAGTYKIIKSYKNLDKILKEIN
tara:strand:- start:3092 stop:3757 length:666 start_codon:yes stop_codon:yes gene_type:complete